MPNAVSRPASGPSVAALWRLLRVIACAGLISGCAKHPVVEATFDLPLHTQWEPKIAKIDLPKVLVSWDQAGVGSELEAMVVAAQRPPAVARGPRVVIQVGATGTWTGPLTQRLVDAFVGGGLDRVSVLREDGAVEVHQEVGGGVQLRGSLAQMLPLTSAGLFDLVLKLREVELSSAELEAAAQVRIADDAMATYRTSYEAHMSALQGQRSLAAEQLSTYERAFAKAKADYLRRGGSFDAGTDGARALRVKQETVDGLSWTLRSLDEALAETIPPDQLIPRALEKLEGKKAQVHTAVVGVELVHADTQSVLWRGTLRAKADAPMAAVDQCVRWLLEHTPGR
jgi:hypothetical protein